MDLTEIETLWRAFRDQADDGGQGSVSEFASSNAEHASVIKSLFPTLIDLQCFSGESLSSGALVGPYKIVGVIGSGGMSTVFRARKATNDTPVAVKVVEFHNGAALKRFKHESEVISNLRHDNIVPFYDFGEYETGYYYSMKLIEGPNLAEVLHPESEIPAEELSAHERHAARIAKELTNNWSLQLDLLKQAAEALDYAHRNQVLHRDVKPGNLLLETSKKLWVADFGLAKLCDAPQRLSLRSRVVGTPRYMPPEQIRGEADKRSDIYGLGLVAYELAILKDKQTPGRPSLWEGGLRSPRELNASIPMSLEQLILKATMPDPRDRFQSMQEFLQAISKCQAVEHPHSFSATLPKNDLIARGNNWKLASGLILALAVIVIGASWRGGRNLIQGNDQSKSEVRDSKLQNAVNLSSDANSDHFPSASVVRCWNKMFVPGTSIIELTKKQLAYPIQLEFASEATQIENVIARLSGGAGSPKFVLSPSGVLSALEPNLLVEGLDTTDQESSNTDLLELDLNMRISECRFGVLTRNDGSTFLRVMELGRDQSLTPVIDFPWPFQDSIGLASYDGASFYFITPCDDSTSPFGGAFDLVQATFEGTGWDVEVLESELAIEGEPRSLATTDGQNFSVRVEMPAPSGSRVSTSPQVLETSNSYNVKTVQIGEELLSEYQGAFDVGRTYFASSKSEGQLQLVHQLFGEKAIVETGAELPQGTCFGVACWPTTPYSNSHTQRIYIRVKD